MSLPSVSLANFTSLWRDDREYHDPDLRSLNVVTLKFQQLRTQYPGAWKWLLRSNHEDARKARAVLFCLAHWPFPENIPWLIVTTMIDEMIRECKKQF